MRLIHSVRCRLQEARAAGVATVAITDRSRLLQFLTGEGVAGAAQAKRARLAAAAQPSAQQPTVRGDGLLPGPDDVSLSTCVQLCDRNSILLSRNKVRACRAVSAFNCLLFCFCAGLVQDAP